MIYGNATEKVSAPFQ